MIVSVYILFLFFNGEETTHQINIFLSFFSRAYFKDYMMHKLEKLNWRLELVEGLQNLTG